MEGFMPLKINYPKQAIKLFLESRFPDTDWSTVIDQMPEIVWRHRWNSLAERYGLPYRKGHVQNLDSRGVGPSSFCSKISNLTKNVR
jgi:hypothetical protein